MLVASHITFVVNFVAIFVVDFIKLNLIEIVHNVLHLNCLCVSFNNVIVIMVVALVTIVVVVVLIIVIDFVAFTALVDDVHDVVCKDLLAEGIKDGLINANLLFW